MKMLLRINDEWWFFTGITSSAWQVLWSEKKKVYYLNQDDGTMVLGQKMAQVMFA
jgi:hypothetical protein